jgi:type II secretory pathway pseudopilin PulG
VRTLTPERGTTLLEGMIAMAVLMIGAMGAISAQKIGVQTNADARRLTRASAVAQDLVDQIALWPYGDPRLQNANPANDADLGDTAQAFENPAPPADHGEADLGAGFAGLSTAEIQDGFRFERFWNVAYVDDADGDGVPDAARIAVIVRWPVGGIGANQRFRRIVAFSTKHNPAELR